MSQINYTCSKCGNSQCEVRELRGSGGFWTKIFDVQSQRFTSVICTRCSFTELFHTDSSKLGNVFDFFTS